MPTDGFRLDAFARRLGAARGRRALVRLLAGAGAALVAVPAGAQEDAPAAGTPDASSSQRAGARQRCAGKRERCKADGDCCSGLACIDRRCKRDDGGACKGEGRGCARSRECCDDLICSDGECARKVPVRFERAWNGSTTAAGALLAPEGIAVDPVDGDDPADDLVYVADTGNDRVVVFAVDGGYETRWGSTGSGNTQLRDPSGIAVNPRDGRVFVADRANHRVVVYEPDGAYVAKLGRQGAGAGEFDLPAGLVVTSARNPTVFVTDPYNERVQVLTLDNDRLNADDEFGTGGAGTGQFRRPSGIALSAAAIVVADAENDRVLVFDRATFAYVRAIGAPGDGEGRLDGPRGVAIDDRDRVWVCDTNNDRVQVFAIDGAFQFAFDGAGTGGGRLDRPRGIAVAGNDDDGYRVYVADTGNDQIQKFVLPARR